jgi:hypothetical protein
LFKFHLSNNVYYTLNWIYIDRSSKFSLNEATALNLKFARHRYFVAAWYLEVQWPTKCGVPMLAFVSKFQNF